MIYSSAIEQIRGSAAAQKKQQSENSLIPLFRLAKVTSLSSGRAYVQLYGEDAASSKLYPYIEGYKPTVGDDVLLCQQGSTFIIVGKISKTNITDNYYLMKSAAENLYLKQTDAASTYLEKTSAEATYLKQSDASSTYLSKSDATSTYLKKTDASSTYLAKTDASSTYLAKTDASSTYLSKTDATSTYLKKTDAASTYLTKTTADTLYAPIGSTGTSDRIENTSYYVGFTSSTSKVVIGNVKSGSTQALDLGSTTYQWNAGFFKTLGGTAASTAIGTLNVKDTNLYGDILPDSTGTRSLGSSSKKFKEIFTDALTMATIGATKWKPNASYSFSIDATADSSKATFTPSSSGKIHFGTSTYKFGNAYFTNGYFTNGYFDTIGGVDQANSLQTLNVKTVNLYGNVIPDTNNSRSLGSSSKNFSSIYSNTIYGTDAYLSKLHFGSQSYNIELVWSSASNMTLKPSTSSAINLGNSNYQYNNVYGKQFYQNGTAISTSDRRKKTGIKGIARKYIDFFRKLKPRLFRFKDGESGRLHSGFIAQEVEEAAIDSGIDNKDLAFICIDENGNYGLRYEELIAIQTKVIQDLMNKVERLEDRVEDLERIVKGGA